MTSSYDGIGGESVTDQKSYAHLHLYVYYNFLRIILIKFLPPVNKCALIKLSTDFAVVDDLNLIFKSLSASERILSFISNC